MENLLKTFRDIGGLSPENEKLLLDTIERVEYPSKTILLEEGKVCNSLYFVEKGLTRIYLYKDGKDVTCWIGPENEFIGAIGSFFTREPSNKWIETLEPCVLWKFDYVQLEKLFSTSRELEKIGRLFSNQGILLLDKRLDNIHFNTAAERYEMFIKNHPDILQRVPLSMVASYLGMTQETLSRIRAQK